MGLNHLTYGPFGALQATIVGVLFATTCLIKGRNLWPLIVAHAADVLTARKGCKHRKFGAGVLAREMANHAASDVADRDVSIVARWLEQIGDLRPFNYRARGFEVRRLILRMGVARGG